MSDVVIPDDAGGQVVDEPMSEALSRRYLAYALSTIMHRALPDVRDGMKPVHRRIMYAMGDMRLTPEAAARKCAKVVGEVMGTYHPHGDQAIYDALVRMAQDFAQRYQLVDGQGNFGNIDGDNPAAMRYTECRLTPAAMLLLEGINENAVDFRPTYDDQDEEPVILPAGFPNLLANGSMGIAVGMATSIPPHNVAELIDACRKLLTAPETTTAELMEFIPGPDFPTGGICVESRASIQEAYETGRGSIRTRARYEVEELGRGNWRIVVREIPYQVQKSRLIEQLADLIENKKAPLLGDVRDESDEEVRLVLEPKTRNIEPEVLMESLFKVSDLETRFGVNINVLDGTGTPRVMGLRACLIAFLDHRRVVLQRTSQWRLEKIEKRLHLLDGLMIAFLNLDEVIRIIREEEKPRDVLMARFKLTEVQADYILDTRLRQLARLEEMTIQDEHKKLSEERDELNKLLGSEKLQWKRIDQQLVEVRKKLLSARRTTFAEAPANIEVAAIESYLPKEPITVILSKRGWIRAAKGAVADPSELKFKEGDELAWLVPAMTTDKLLIMTSDGRFLTLACDKLPSARGHGEPLRLMVDFEDGAKIVTVFVAQAGQKRVMVSKNGYGFVMNEEDGVANKRAGKQVLNVEGTEALAALPVIGDSLMVLGENNKLLIFPVSELPEMARGKGVKLQAYKDGGVRDIAVFDSGATPQWYDGSGKAREFKDFRDYQGKRAQAGKMAPRGLRKLRV
ncbi:MULTISPECIES: DNA topoisomerase IV subunit A [Asticcacaulis]|uniref:DNA topoisomerase IV subunit A n=1 Tax=Asticcacaulis TaxID=76890 RepID=UPI001AE772DB|nr:MULTISPECIES: DNA topoisomerase IV subunit A [Asticcacaulis]MBP2158400.1 topoisomerase-4 subunit A [Asticcacaulis solisilvae]MDR6799445.1 topoisomerase-4 subunit A [Asticcacaulis sp. BE141]